MRCAFEALILILLCQTPFAVGLNFGSIQTQSYLHEPEIESSFTFKNRIMPEMNSRALFMIFSDFFAFAATTTDFTNEDSTSLIPSSTNGLPEISPTRKNSPDNGIIIDPDELPKIDFDDPSKKVISVISPQQGKYKYVISKLDDPVRGRFTEFQRITFDPTLPDPEASFRAIIQLRPDEPYFFEDSAGSLFSPTINFISDTHLAYMLSFVITGDTEYIVIYQDDGCLMIKVRYKDGTTKTYTQEEILFKFGEWFNEFFDRYFAVVETYSEPYTVYRHQSRSVVIPERKAKKPINSGPDHSTEPVDGQGNSKAASGRGSPKTPESSNPLQPTKPQRQLSDPIPGPSNEKPPEASRRSRDDGDLLAIPQKEKTKPEHRFTVAKATSELAETKKLQTSGAKKLAQAITRGELRSKFKHLDNFPQYRSAKTQIKWLLNHGHNIALSELIVEKATHEWMDGTAHTLVGGHLKRAQSLRRTIIKSSDSSHQHTALAEQLARLNTPKSVTVEKSKPKDLAALLPFLKNGWRIILTNGKEAPLYNSAQQRKLLTNAGSTNIDEDLTVSTQKALEFLLWDDQEVARVSKLISQVVSPKLENEMKEALESTPSKPGMIETALGIASYIRLVNHPAAGGGRLVLGPSQRHIKVSYYNNEASEEYVLIEVSIEFSNIAIFNPLQEQTDIPLTMAVRTVHRFPLNTRSGEATPLPDNRVIIASNPSLPSPPTPEVIQRWTNQIHDNHAQLFNKNLKQVEDRLQDWDKRASLRPPVDIKQLTEDSRKLKLAQKDFSHNFAFARNWNDLSADELQRVAQKLSEAMKQYQQLLDSVLENDSLYQGDSHQEGWQLVRDYKKYVQDMEDVYLRMKEINNRRHALTRDDLDEIDKLNRLTVEIGDRARNLSGDKLPLRRTALKEAGELTQEQYDRTEQLRKLYYPLTSKFHIARAQALFNPPAEAVEDTDYHRTSTFIPDDEHGEPPAISTAPELSPLEVTMPFIFSDGSQEGFEADIPEPQAVIEQAPEDGDEDS